MSKIVELEKQLMQRNKELDVVRVSVLAAAVQISMALQLEAGPAWSRSIPEQCIDAVYLLQPFQRRHSKVHIRYVYTCVRNQNLSSFSTSRLQILGATLVSPLGEDELIL